VNAFDVLGDPVRRRILELLAEGETASGGVVEVVSADFGISQAAVSQHLKVLRESGFASVRAEGTRRLYRVETGGFEQIDQWLGRFRVFWESHLDALDAEIERGKRARANEGKNEE
jgi:DNA-binding transcriptional ArsR family regulator